MRAKICSLLLAALVVVGACNKPETPEAPKLPEVVLEPSGWSDFSISFVIHTTNADNVAYLVYPSYEQKSYTAADVLEEGTPADPGQIEVTVGELVSGVTYVVLAAAENSAGMSELAKTEISTSGNSYTFTASQANCWFYGEQSTGTDLFLLQISDVECDDYYLRPQGAGNLLRLYLVTEPVADDQTPALVPGTYVCAEPGEYTPGTFFVTADGSGYPSQFGIGTSADLDDWGLALLCDGTVTVEYNDGVYSISAVVTVDNEEGSSVVAGYEGAILTEDLSEGVRHFYKDVTGIGFYSFGATVFDSSSEGADSWTATAINCPVDGEGYVSGAGYVMNFSLYAPAAGYGNYEIEGTYSASYDLSPYSYYPGYVYESFLGIMPYGTHLAYYGESLYLEYVGLIESGDIVITRDGETYRMVADGLTTTKGYKVSFTYEGPLSPVYDYRSASGEAASTMSVSVPLGVKDIKIAPAGPWSPLE